jgi:hypothetical protein
VNPKAETVEELQGRRKTLHMGMLKLARDGLSLKLQAAIDSSVVSFSPPSSLYERAPQHSRETDALPYFGQLMGSLIAP